MKSRIIIKINVILFMLLFIYSNVKFNVRADIKTSEPNSEITNNISELERVKQEQIENIKQLNGVEKEIAQYMYDISDIDSKMIKYSQSLNELQDKLNDLNSELSKNESSLSDTSSVYKKELESYSNRLRVLYENGVPNIADILTNSESISDFFTKMNLYTTILENQKEQLSKMKNQKSYISYVQQNIETQKKQIESLKKDIENSNELLNQELAKKQSRVSELTAEKSNLQEASKLLTKQKEDALKTIEDEIQKAINSQNSLVDGSSTEFTGGNFIWPVPGFNTITTRFQEIYTLVNPAGSAHTGVDIAGANINATPMLAIESGTVIVAGYNAGGYGNYVMINHGKCTDDGNNYISLYGHASSLAVKTGDYVEKGQVIAYVGTTGNSTGPHLHLEIRINGKITDPLVQYPGLTFRYV